MHSAKTIVITRPSGQARQLHEALAKAIEKSGISPNNFPKILSLPLLTIVPKEEEQLADYIASALNDADLAIFVSPNAIESVMRLLSRNWQDFSKNVIPVGVMGGSSALALKNHGIGLEQNPTPIVIPSDHQRWDSEGLWHALQDLNWNWAGKKVVIFKGEGGRDWLADTLHEAGASVVGISTYARVPLSPQHAAWQALKEKEIDFSQSLWLLTSSEAVRYLGQVVQEQGLLSLQTASAMCSHQNIANTATQVGFGKIYISEPGDEALIKASLAWLMTE